MPLIASRMFSTSAPDLLGLVSPPIRAGWDSKKEVEEREVVRQEDQPQQEIDGQQSDEQDEQARHNELLLSFLPPDLLQNLPATATADILSSTNTTLTPSSFDDLFSLSVVDCEQSNWCESERIADNEQLFEQFYWDVMEEEKEKEREKEEKENEEKENEEKKKTLGLNQGAIIRRHKTMCE